MSDKLWNKATKALDWQSLQKEYETILNSAEAEDLSRKEELTRLFIKHQKEEIWDAVDKEHRYLLKNKNNPAVLTRLLELEAMVKDHNREFVFYGPLSWLVEYE